MSKQVPRWVKEYVQKCVEALGIEGWDITITMERTVGKDDKVGRAHIQHRYEVAHIELRDTIQPDQKGYEIITHELLHLAFSPYTMGVLNVIEMVPTKQQKVAEGIADDGEEIAVVHLSRALSKVLQKGLSNK